MSECWENFFGSGGLLVATQKSKYVYLLIFTVLTVDPAKLPGNLWERAQATPSIHISACSVSLFSLITLN